MRSIVIKRAIVYAYIYSLPFSHAFSFRNGVITFTLIIGIIMAVYLVITKSLIISRKLYRYISIPLIFVVYIALNSLINVEFYISYWNHVISYVSSVLVFFVFPSLFLMSIKTGLSANNLLRVVTNMTVITSMYSVAQFFMNNFAGINLDDFLIWGTEDVSNTMALGNFYRAKGFFAEPGHFAFFLEIMLPLNMWYLFSSSQRFSLKNIFYLLLLVTAFTLTMSAAGWAFLLFGLICAILTNLLTVIRAGRRFWLMITLVSLLMLSLIVCVNSYVPLYEMIIGNTLDKLDSGSAADRLSRWDAFIRVISQMNLLDMVFGYGPNAMVNLGYPSGLTIILLYPLLYVELGLIGIVLFVSIFVFVFFKSIRINESLRFFAQMSLFSSLGHYSMISNYWYPYLWFLGVLIFFFVDPRNINDKSDEKYSENNFQTRCGDRFDQL